MTTLHVRTTPKKLTRDLGKLASAASGKVSSRAAREMMRRIGEAVLDIVSDAFIDKAAGNADESGLRWEPLSPATIAYRRKRVGVLWPPKSRAKYAPSYALKKGQRKRWWAVYYQILRKTGDKGGAASGAWRILKGEGATTLMDLYGNAPALILRESGKLFRSLLPSGGRKPQYQVFRVTRGTVEVGTSRPFATVHHYGGGHVPQRRLWPAPSQWPQSWWKLINKQVIMGIGEITKELLQGKP